MPRVCSSANVGVLVSGCPSRLQCRQVHSSIHKWMTWYKHIIHCFMSKFRDSGWEFFNLREPEQDEAGRENNSYSITKLRHSNVPSPHAQTVEYKRIIWLCWAIRGRGKKLVYNVHPSFSLSDQMNMHHPSTPLSSIPSFFQMPTSRDCS